MDIKNIGLTKKGKKNKKNSRNTNINNYIKCT